MDNNRVTFSLSLTLAPVPDRVGEDRAERPPSSRAFKHVLKVSPIFKSFARAMKASSVAPKLLAKGPMLGKENAFQRSKEVKKNS